MTELNRQILEQIARSCADGVVVVDAQSADYRVVYVNPAYERLTGNLADDVVGLPWPLLNVVGAETVEGAQLRAALGRAETHTVTLPDVRSDGTSWLSQIRIEPVKNRRGRTRHLLILQSEAPAATDAQRELQVGLLQRELNRARQRAANLDRMDPASGLMRYGHFREMAERDCRVARREKREVALAVFVINDLDVYRETFGVQAADSCLRMVAAQVTGALRRAGDLCGCDDEKRIFAFTTDQSAEELEDVTEHIAENVRRLGLHNPRGRHGRHVSVSAAVTGCVPSATGTAVQLIEDALARLKESGGGARRAARA